MKTSLMRLIKSVSEHAARGWGVLKARIAGWVRRIDRLRGRASRVERATLADIQVCGARLRERPAQKPSVTAAPQVIAFAHGAVDRLKTELKPATQLKAAPTAAAGSPGSPLTRGEK